MAPAHTLRNFRIGIPQNHIPPYTCKVFETVSPSAEEGCRDADSSEQEMTVTISNFVHNPASLRLKLSLESGLFETIAIGTDEHFYPDIIETSASALMFTVSISYRADRDLQKFEFHLSPKDSLKKIDPLQKLRAEAFLAVLSPVAQNMAHHGLLTYKDLDAGETHHESSNNHKSSKNDESATNKKPSTNKKSSINNKSSIKKKSSTNNESSARHAHGRMSAPRSTVASDLTSKAMLKYDNLCLCEDCVNGAAPQPI